MTSCECLKILLFLFSQTCHVHCVNVLKDYFSEQAVSFITEKRKSRQSNKQRTVLHRNSHKFNQAENSTKHEFEKEKLKTKINASSSICTVQMAFTVCVKDGSDYVKISSVYFNIF